jgi:hypothetical protein
LNLEALNAVNVASSCAACHVYVDPYGFAFEGFEVPFLVERGSVG